MASGPLLNRALDYDTDDHDFPELEWVSKKSLKSDDICPICNNAFFEGKCFGFLRYECI